MKITFSKSALLLIGLMAVGSLFLANTATHTAAQGDISSDIEAGDTIWYHVHTLTGLTDLLDFESCDEYGNNCDGLPEGTTLTGTLQDSDIFVKVLSTQTEQMKYFDGSVMVTGTLPTVDITAGLMTGNDILFHLEETAETCNTYTDDFGGYVDCYGATPELNLFLPEGSVIPFPFVFGTATQFNVSDTPLLVAPIPFVLNDNYALHETVLNIAITQIDGATLDVTNSASTFGFTLSASDPEEGVSGEVSVMWRKSDGLPVSVDLELNGPDGEHIVFGISLTEVDHHGLNLRVGDTFSLDVSAADFDFAVSGFPAEDNPADDLAEIKSELNSLEGTTLLDLEVVEIDGIYYKVTGDIYNPDTSTMQSISDLTDGELDGLWMTGFGPLHYSLVRLGGFGITIGGGDDYYDNNCYFDDDGYYVCPDVPYDSSDDISSWSDAELRRILSLPGFAITEDNNIYSGYDSTEEAIINMYGDLLVWALGTDEGVTADLAWDIDTGIQDGGYFVTESVSWDVSIVMEGTNEFDQPTVVNVNSMGALQSSLSYDEFGIFDELSFTGGFSVDLTDGDEAVSLEISNFELRFTGSFTTESGDTLVDTDVQEDTEIDLGTNTNEPTSIGSDTVDTSSDPSSVSSDPSSVSSDPSSVSSDITDDGDDTAPNPLPGFGFIFALFSVGTVSILRKRK